MSLGITTLIGSIFKPAADLIDNVHTSDEERLVLRNEFTKIEAEMQTKLIELQGKLNEATARVAVAETQSSSALTRNYRPALVVSMFIMLCLNSFGVLTVPLPDIFVQAFAGVFSIVSISRGAEKVIAIRSKK